MIRATLARRGALAQRRFACQFCQMTADDQGPSRRLCDRRLWETANFTVVPTLGSIVEGWFLLVSKSHHLCFGALPSEIRAEGQDLLERVASWVRAHYGPATVFEHGPATESSPIGCGIDHAHLHIVHLPFGLLEEARFSPDARQIAWDCCESFWRRAAELHKAGVPYLLIKEPGRSPSVGSPAYVPCQFLRRLIAARQGRGEEFDYRTHAFDGNIRSTIETVLAGRR